MRFYSLLLSCFYAMLIDLNDAEFAPTNIQTGSTPIPTTGFSYQEVSVAFRRSYSELPVVYAWARSTFAEFRVEINSITQSQFTVIVYRTDQNSGWDLQPTLHWQAQIEPEVSSKELPAGSGKLNVQILFETTYDNVPIVHAWARGRSEYPDIFSVNVYRVTTTYFLCTVTRTDNPSEGWGQKPWLYWTISEIQQDRVKLLGSGPVGVNYDTPGPVWVFTPAVTETNPDVFDFMGREVHLSTVRKLLVENTQGRFPLTHTTSSLIRMQIVIRADTVYLDSSINFQGLKNVKILARKLVSNGHTLTMEAPTICESFDGSACHILDKANEMADGANGKSGVNSPFVEVYLYEMKGDVYFISKASDGNPGQEGGDGHRGLDNTWESDGLTDSETCDKDCGPAGGEKIYRGKPGPDGGNGGQARRSGKSGSGGTSKAMDFYVQKMNGYLNLTQHPGLGGEPAGHGLGGSGGSGGIGGCGKRCQSLWTCILLVCWPECVKEDGCEHRGEPGTTGDAGGDGFKIYPRPEQGTSGSIQEPTVTTTSTVKPWFNNDLELLKLIQRHAESLFQRNNNKEAEDIFSFLLSVADTNSVLYKEASLSLTMIQQGFDYYGNDQAYAPDLDWSFLKSRTDSLMAAGKSYEDAYNTIMEDIEDIMLVSSAMEFVVSLSIQTEDQQLANQEGELKSAKNLYVKALKQIESTMKGEMLEINILVPLVIVKEKVEELISGIPGLIGGIAGFVKGLVFLNPVEAFSGVMEVINVFTGKPECQTPKITQAADTLQERLDFGYEWERINPEEFDFSSMDASAVPLIMLSELGKNKASLFHELECLFQDPDSDLVAKLERVINDFYRDAAVRIALIDKLMNIDVQLKTISKNRQLLIEAQATLDAAVNMNEENIAMEVKLSFSDYLFNLYQTQENNIMRSIYELSKSYQFSCLWDFHALENYKEMFSDIVITSNTGSLQGMFELQMLQQDLENQKNVFLNRIASSSGPTSHSFNSMWEFNKDTHPEVIESLRTTGQFTVGVELDPDDVATARCQSCYNARLGSLYVELIGKSQPSSVPNTIHVKVAHMGDSSFLIPLDETSQGVVYLQQTPENVDGGHVMSFDADNLIKSIQDPYLGVKFLKSEHIFCDDAHSFFGAKPCKSPYASYVITVPRSDTLVCSKDPNDLISGTNCQDLDFTMFDAVRVYAKMDSWSDYPVQPDVATMKSLIKSVNAASNTK